MNCTDEVCCTLMLLENIIHDIEKSKAESEIRMTKVESILRDTNDILTEIAQSNEITTRHNTEE